MTLAQKKLDIAQWVLGLEDEALVEKLASSVHAMQKEFQLSDQEFEATSYKDIASRSFDLEALKQAQNIVPFAKGELEQLVQEAAIAEPLSELLAGLD